MPTLWVRVNMGIKNSQHKSGNKNMTLRFSELLTRTPLFVMAPYPSTVSIFLALLMEKCTVKGNLSSSRLYELSEIILYQRKNLTNILFSALYK